MTSVYSRNANAETAKLQNTPLNFTANFWRKKEVHDTWPRKFLWSNELPFLYLDGAESIQNCRIWADWNPGKHTTADAVGVARSVVARLWNRFQETGNVRRRPGEGRPRTTTSTDDQYIQLTASRNRTENATQLQRQLLLATGRRVSSQTLRNRLHEGGLRT
ncbi:uncharacterized protein TNCV_2811041 [Trichonephila clavipes]|nr:uncharacterized protein TNCV_2811041 [Trichonephila clavipes]